MASLNIDIFAPIFTIDSQSGLQLWKTFPRGVNMAVALQIFYSSARTMDKLIIQVIDAITESTCEI
jgi:hypothetical protein